MWATFLVFFVCGLKIYIPKFFRPNLYLHTSGSLSQKSLTICYLIKTRLFLGSSLHVNQNYCLLAPNLYLHTSSSLSQKSLIICYLIKARLFLGSSLHVNQNSCLLALF